MKISMMTNDQAADALVKMSGAIGEIVADEESIPMLQQLYLQLDNEHYQESIVAVLMKFVPFLLRKHRESLYTIIAALDGKSESDMGKFNFLATLRVLRDSFDRDLLDFFKSSGAAQPSAGEKSA